MKKLNFSWLALFIVTLFTSISIFSSCQKDEALEEIEVFLDIDPANIQNDPNAINIIRAACLRLDKYITFDDNQFHLDISSGRKVRMSDRLFSLLRSQIQKTNKMIRECTAGMVPVEIAPNTLKFVDTNQKVQFVLTKSTSETTIPAGGVNGVISYWWGSETYLSHKTMTDVLAALKAGNTVSTVLASLGYVGGIALAALSQWQIQEYEAAIQKYPNGIILTDIIGVITISQRGQTVGQTVVW